MTEFLINISYIVFDMSFDKSYSAVKNIGEIYMSKQNMLSISPYIQSVYSIVCKYLHILTWFGMAITKYVMLHMYISIHSMVK
jgi:hypothetical protein